MVWVSGETEKTISALPTELRKPRNITNDKQKRTMNTSLSDDWPWTESHI
jgi:hypothetical protein